MEPVLFDHAGSVQYWLDKTVIKQKQHFRITQQGNTNLEDKDNKFCSFLKK